MLKNVISKLVAKQMWHKVATLFPHSLATLDLTCHPQQALTGGSPGTQDQHML